MSDFYSLTVTAITQLTPNSVAVSFEIPEPLKETFTFEAGQYITIKHLHNGTEIRRAYSISSLPNDSMITIGIKKVPDGTFSVFANTELKKGDVLEIMPPEGRFVFIPSGKPQHIAAFAAGSGITPIMSIARTVLSTHSENKLVLVYGNRSIAETMFYTEITAMMEEYTNRFFVYFVYSRAEENDGLFGRIDNSTVNYIAKNKFKDTAFDAYYLCGPEPMIQVVSETLKANGVASDKIYFELFTSPEEVDKESVGLVGKTTLEVTLEDEVFSFSMDRRTKVLDAVLDEGIDAPYSCQGGVCSTCIARITEGKASMEKNQILTDGEIEEGFILTCQAHPSTPVLKVDYDDV